MGNLLADLPDASAGEVVELLAGSGAVRIERITSAGQSTPEGSWYDQLEHEWVTVLSGTATLQWADGTEQDLSPGDWVEIPAHVRHRVAATSPTGPTVWLAVFWAVA